MDESGDTKGETRFHAFKKVSNNKNKGARVEAPIEGVDTSFVLPQGSVITFFMREDAYEGSKVFVNAGDTAVVPAFTPLVLQLSGTNCEQALKGNGLKLRRIMHLRTECLTPFMADLCTSKHEALQRQELGRRYPRSRMSSAAPRPRRSCAPCSRTRSCSRTRTSSGAGWWSWSTAGSTWTWRPCSCCPST